MTVPEPSATPADSEPRPAEPAKPATPAAGEPLLSVRDLVHGATTLLAPILFILLVNFGDFRP